MRFASAWRIALILVATPCVGLLSGPWRTAHAEGVVVDKISRPAPVRQFKSPAGGYEFTISSADNWKTPHGVAALVQLDGKTQRPRWNLALPHFMGPRTALVADSGTVVLVDEWINSPSRHALMVISPKGEMLADISFDELVAALGVERRDISTHARLGVWMSAAPVPSADGGSIRFAAGGRHLSIRLADGHLSASD